MDDKHLHEMKNALAQIQIDIEDAEKKKRQKIWKQAAVYPCSLHDALQGMTKQQMDDIRSELQLKNISGLKKAELVEALADRIPHALLEQLKLMGRKQYERLQILDRNGVMEAGGISFSAISALLKRGLAFPALKDGKPVLIMPDEIRAVFREHDTEALQKQVGLNDEIIHHAFLLWCTAFIRCAGSGECVSG
ncbi:hypothetical protein [Salibacterium sp. K-3]